MAAAAVSTSAIDLRSQATFPIRLGNTILRPSDATQFTSIRYNHKPNLKDLEALSASINEGDVTGESRLSIDVGNGEYLYSGKYGHDEGSFVLVVKGQGKDKEMVLERASQTHGYNLVGTPSERNASKLANEYPRLQEDIAEDGLLGDDDEEMPPDDTNPFDYRHFLKAELDKSESVAAALDVSRSAAATPVVRARPSGSTPLNRPVKRADNKPQPLQKRKAPVVEKANHKRVRAGQEAKEVVAETSKSRAKPELPKISLDRKASLRRPSVDDSGELILENETPVTERAGKQAGALALALNGQLGTGPISLRSAANSPHSHVTSPAPQRLEGMEEEYVFEFDDDPEPEGQAAQGADEGDEEAEIVEEDDDADVEDLELPSPAQLQNHRPSVPGPAAVSGGDDDDDLDRKLALAMMEEDDGDKQESEESEEE